MCFLYQELGKYGCQIRFKIKNFNPHNQKGKISIPKSRILCNSGLVVKIFKVNIIKKTQW